MAYFPNGSAGGVFEEQCSRCRYGEQPCPIYLVQSEFNYKAVGKSVASAILNALVKNDGTCAMFKLDEAWFGSALQAAPEPDTARRMLNELCK